MNLEEFERWHPAAYRSLSQFLGDHWCETDADVKDWEIDFRITVCDGSSPLEFIARSTGLAEIWLVRGDGWHWRHLLPSASL